MVTNLREDSRSKCEQYWPDSGSTSYGPLRVSLKDQQIFADYTIRTMEVIVSVSNNVLLYTVMTEKIFSL